MAKPYRVRAKNAGKSTVSTQPKGSVCVLQMDRNWDTNESVLSSSFLYPDL